MAWFRKKADPISERARALTDEIAQIEAKIKQLDSQLQNNLSQPRIRSTAMPHGTTLSYTQTASTPLPPSLALAHEPIFEPVDRDRLQSQTETATTPEHFNELGVRKYDLPALWQRIRSHFRGPSTTNPKLVSYLAAGGIQGLRPLRYQQRVSRRRFLFFFALLFLILLGIICWSLKS